jgi:vacuolar-type H+-ATPase subunit H
VQSFINELFNPDRIVPLAGVMIEDELPGLRRTLQASLVEQAPVWAEGLSTTAVEAAPKVREQLEDHALSQTTASIQEVVAVGEKEFRSILRENRSSFEETIAKLADDEDYSEETLQIFMTAVNDQLGQDMQDQAQQVLGTLIALREKLEKLAAGETVNQEEATERHALMMIRHLELREADESFEERIKRRDASRVRATDPIDDGESTDGEGTENPAATDADSETKDADSKTTPPEKPEGDSPPAESDKANVSKDNDPDSK